MNYIMVSFPGIPLGKLAFFLNCIGSNMSALIYKLIVFILFLNQSTTKLNSGSRSRNFKQNRTAMTDLNRIFDSYKIHKL